MNNVTLVWPCLKNVCRNHEYISDGGKMDFGQLRAEPHQHSIVRNMVRNNVDNDSAWCIPTLKGGTTGGTTILQTLFITCAGDFVIISVESEIHTNVILFRTLL